jgi:signal peptidase II
MEQSSNPMPLPLWQYALVPLLAGFVILVDQISKRFIEFFLPIYHGWTPIPAFPSLRLAHTTNTGAAFGLFPANSGIFMIAAVVISIAILYYNFTLPARQTLFRLALGLQLGGALGNLVDRLRLGHVTDFIDYGPWVFNLADAAIVTGAFVLAWVMWQESKELIPAPAINSTNEGAWDEQPSH